MQTLAYFRRWLRLLGLGLLLGAILPTVAAQGLLPNPVENLRTILEKKVGNLTVAGGKALIKEVETRADALKNVPDLLIGLLLSEWGRTPIFEDGVELDTMDRLRTDLTLAYDKIRENLRTRARERIEAVVKSNDPGQQVGVLTLIRSAAEETRGKLSERGDKLRASLADLVKEIVPLTSAANEQVQIAAILALGRVEGDPKVIAAALTQVLTSGSLPTRRAVGESLGMIVRYVEGKKDETVYFKEKVPVLEHSYPVMRLALRDSDTVVRRRAVNALLGTTKFFAAQVAPPPKQNEITEKVENDTERYPIRATRIKLVRALSGELNLLGQDLMLAGQDSDAIVRALAFETVEQLGIVRHALVEETKKTEEKIEKMPMPLEKGQKDVRLGAPIPLPAARPVLTSGLVQAVFLAKPVAEEPKPQKQADPIKPGVDATLPSLQRGLNDPNIRVRLSVLDALEAIGEDGAPLIPDLVRTLGDPDRFVRWATARVLGNLAHLRLQERLVVPGLIKVLCDPDTSVRIAVIRALAAYKSAAASALPGLIEQLQKADVDVRVEVIAALIAIGPDSALAIPALVVNLGHEDARIRRLAADAIGRFGPVAIQAADRLEQLSFDEDNLVRRAAAAALLRIKP